MPFKIGPWEIAFVLIIILIVFGVGKLPQVGGAIGKGIRAFKKGQMDEDEKKGSPSEKTEDTKSGKS